MPTTAETILIMVVVPYAQPYGQPAASWPPPFVRRVCVDICRELRIVGTDAGADDARPPLSDLSERQASSRPSSDKQPRPRGVGSTGPHVFAMHQTWPGLSVIRALGVGLPLMLCRMGRVSSSVAYAMRESIDFRRTIWNRARDMPSADRTRQNRTRVLLHTRVKRSGG